MDRFQEALGLSAPPIAIGFSDERPVGLERWDGGAVPAGCVFWREAMKGRSFYTEAADHYNCAVGAYTHGIALPAERGSQLEDTVKFMVSNEYLRMEEVAGIPTLAKGPAFISYGPAEAAAFALLPLAKKSGLASLSLGCMGNRTFTGLPDDELANSDMKQFYQNRQAEFATH